MRALAMRLGRWQKLTSSTAALGTLRLRMSAGGKAIIYTSLQRLRIRVSVSEINGSRLVLRAIAKHKLRRTFN